MKPLSLIKRIQVRFSELDPLRVVWHGNYVKYLEDAREEFGRRYGIGYSELVKNGFYAPVYDVHLCYKRPAVMDDILLVKITYRPVAGAKMVFDYEIRRESDDELILTATTIQLFQKADGEFWPVVPEFYRAWQERVCYDFYNIDSCVTTESGFDFKIRFNSDSEVYKGHFPGKPVAPGVCLVQMVKECYEYASCSVAELKKIKLCRFVKLVDPFSLPEADVRMEIVKEAESAMLKASVSKDGTEYMNIKAELSVVE